VEFLEQRRSGTPTSWLFLIGIMVGGVQFGPLRTAATSRPIVPAPGDYDDGETGRMMIGRGNWSTRRKPAPVPLCPPQTPHAARTRTRAATVGSQRLTAWATVRPHLLTYARVHLFYHNRNCYFTVIYIFFCFFSPCKYVWGADKSLGFLIFLFAAQQKESFLDGLKKLEQRSHKLWSSGGNM
jgi:hypothetical protein